MSTPIKFEKKDEGIFVAFVIVPFTDIYGQDRKGLTALRVKDDGGYFRIDRCDAVAGTWTPFEAIDSVEYPTAEAGIEAALAWAKAKGATGDPEAP